MGKVAGIAAAGGFQFQRLNVGYIDGAPIYPMDVWHLMYEVR